MEDVEIVRRDVHLVYWSDDIISTCYKSAHNNQYLDKFPL